MAWTWPEEVRSWVPLALACVRRSRKTDSRCFEIVLIDFQGDLYGRRVVVEFVKRIRPEEKFDSLEVLTAQMHRDIQAVRDVFSEGRLERVKSTKPRILILATGGTIAGAATSSASISSYTSAVTGIDQIVAAVPDIKRVADVTGEQVLQIGSRL